MTRRVATFALALVLSSTGIAACSGSSGNVGGSGSGSLASATAAAAAPAKGATLDAAAFAAALKRPNTVVLDVRTAAEFGEGHLPGAINIDVNAADFSTKVGALDKAVPYAVYCRSGNRSATALRIMDGLGFTQAYHLGGGIGAWTAAGGPTTTS